MNFLEHAAQQVDCSTHEVHGRRSYSRHVSSSCLEWPAVSSVQNAGDDGQCTLMSTHSTTASIAELHHDHIVCVACRFGELFDHLLVTDHVHNVVGVLCYLQSVTQLLLTAASALSASTLMDESAAALTCSTTNITSCGTSSIVLPLWTSIVAALQCHLNRVSCHNLCDFYKYTY